MLQNPAPHNARSQTQDATRGSLEGRDCAVPRQREALIQIQNLRLRTFIGFNPEERLKPQDVVINIDIRYQLVPAVLDDDVDAALNYKTVVKTVIRHVESGRFLLLEKLVADVLDICSDNPAVRYSKVSIDKPHALRFADSVSLTLEFNRHDHHDSREKLQ